MKSPRIWQSSGGTYRNSDTRYSDIRNSDKSVGITGVGIAVRTRYLPPSRGDIPAFTPAEAGTRFSDPGWMHG